MPTAEGTLGETPTLVVFDVDGTLIDSAELIVGAMQDACQHNDVPFVGERALLNTVGLPLVESVPQLFSELTGPAQRTLIAAYGDAYRRRRQAPDSPETLFAGVIAGLERLVDAGRLLGVATGKSMHGLQAALQAHGLDQLFSTLQASDQGPGKPHPHMLERAMAETGAEPSSTVMIGDTTFDIDMARRARVRGIGVSWGHHSVAALQAAGAVAVVDTFDALVALLLGPGLADTPSA